MTNCPALVSLSGVIAHGKESEIVRIPVLSFSKVPFANRAWSIVASVAALLLLGSTIAPMPAANATTPLPWVLADRPVFDNPAGPLDLAWSSIIYEPQTRKYVATSKVTSPGTGGVWQSDDLVTWSYFQESDPNHDWNSSATCRGTVVAVGDHDAIMANPGLANGNSGSDDFDANNWRSVTCGNGVFVAVGDEIDGGQNTAQVITTRDGYRWRARTSAENNNWTGITFGNGLFVAVARSGQNRVMTSPDGINWTARTAAANNEWTSVTFGNGLFVAVARSGQNRVMTSTNGITWTARPAVANNNWTSVTYGAGSFVAVSATDAGDATTDRIMSSLNGQTWVVEQGPDQSWNGVAYGNGEFVAVSSSSGEDQRIMSFRMLQASKLRMSTTPDPDNPQNFLGTQESQITTSYPSDYVWSMFFKDSDVTCAGNDPVDASGFAQISAGQEIGNGGSPALLTNIPDYGTCAGRSTFVVKIYPPGTDMTVGGIEFNDPSLASVTIELYPGRVECPAGGFYEVDDNGVASNGSTCDGALTLDESVTSVANNAFSYSGIDELTISNTVRSLGNYAFQNAKELTKVGFAPNSSLDVIGYGAFALSLGDPEVEDFLTFTTIKIPKSVTKIGGEAFSNIQSLQEVLFEEGSELQTIGSYAFADSKAIESIEIPKYVTSINEAAFSLIDSLSSVTFETGSQLSRIGLGAFRYSSILESLTIPSEVVQIDEQAFRGMSALTSITFQGNRITAIPDYAFEGAEALTSITIPSSVTSIGASAFGNALSLKSLVIPADVSTIGTGAFWGATSLDSFYFLGDAPPIGQIGNAFCVEDSVNIGQASPGYCVAPLAKAFIQPDAIGFQSDDPSAAGYGPSKTEIYWKGLIVRTAPSYVTSAVYRDWDVPLPTRANGPKVGEAIYASAYERELSRELLQDALDANNMNFRFGQGQGDSYIYEVEEYAYRITKQPNSSSSSVDRQSATGYEELSTLDQEHWYEEMGFTNSTDYQFSWRAFMCVSGYGQSIELSTPNNIRLNYASREDGPLENNENAVSFMFRDAAGDILLNRSPSTRTVVGMSYYENGGAGLVGGMDVFQLNSHALGILEVNSSCGVGKTLQAFRIVDPDTDLRIATKEFVIPEQLRLELPGGDYVNVDPVGQTIGVTGAVSVTFNAALWGLTTIAPSTRPDISLSSVNETVAAGTAIAGYTVSNTGGLAGNFEISPAVGNGLSFNTATGALTGTPTAAASPVTYTITAVNVMGSSTATFTLTVRGVNSSNSTPQQSSSYAGPQVTLFTPRILEVDRAQTVRVFGDRLDQVKAISHGGITLSFKVVSDREIEINVPGLAVGVKEIKFDAGTSGIVTYINAFEVKGPYIGTPTASPIPEPSSPGVSSPLRTSTIWGFVAGSTRLDSKGVKNLSTVASRLASAKEISCVGYTMGPTALARDIQLSYNRAMTVCKRLAASIPGAKIIKVEGRQDTRTGDRVRRVEVKWRG